jgi:UDP-N-acetylmuramoylalanine--D-glutamate ligase
MMMYRDKQIVIIGAARQGTALARFLAKNGANVVLNDSRMPSQLQEARTSLQDQPIGWVLGAHPVRLLDSTEVVCPSGGVPLELPIVAEALRRGIPLSNDSQIFMETAPCPVIGITGSAGKTTTTTIVGRIAKAAMEKINRTAWVGGNIGNPLIENVDQMDAEDIAVVELSSFQLELMHRSPQVAAVLNITPNHLDRHGTMEAYARAKANILAFQNPADITVLNRDDAASWGLANQLRGRLATYGNAVPENIENGLAQWGSHFSVMDVYPKDGIIYLRDSEGIHEIMPIADILLRGVHNLQNVMAACAIAAAAGLPVEAMRAGISGFRGVTHRMEFVREWGGAEWYNDTIATAPERAMAGIRAFEGPLVLLAGGQDKDLPWDEFAALICERVDHLVAFGETGTMIAEKVKALDSDRPYSIEICKTLEPAVQAAANVVKPGDTVLLSPGGTSFDEFIDFASRGEMYKQWVLQLP